MNLSFLKIRAKIKSKTNFVTISSLAFIKTVRIKNKNKPIKQKPSGSQLYGESWKCQLLGKLRWEKSLDLSIQDQTGQCNETLPRSMRNL